MVFLLCPCFNLNLLECKFTVIILYHVLGIVLISTYWNVNSFPSNCRETRRSVLISTYWNVNADNEIEVEENMIVLISTYWNVNVFEHNAEQNKTEVLISTYWNVNPKVPLHQKALRVLISTYWNVNNCQCLNADMAEQF